MLALPTLVLKLAITAWLAVATLLDRRTGRIPNGLTLPVMLVAGGYRLAQAISPRDFAPLLSKRVAFLSSPGLRWLSPEGSLLPPMASPSFVWMAWLIIFILWLLNTMGGGDAKLLMGLFAIFPSWEFAFSFACLLLLIGLPWLLLARWGMRMGAMFQPLYVRLLTHRLLPTADELAARRGSYVWLLCLPAVVYTWLLW